MERYPSPQGLLWDLKSPKVALSYGDLSSQSRPASEIVKCMEKNFDARRDYGMLKVTHTKNVFNTEKNSTSHTSIYLVHTIQPKSPLNLMINVLL